MLCSKSRNKFATLSITSCSKATGLVLVVAFLFGVSSVSASAQTAAAPAAKNNPEQQYKGCSNGYYMGPRPGRVRYTKDPWIWVVTPEFAKKFCMPAEFVSTELKGAEAIAFKINVDNDEEICGWGDRVEVCSGRKNLRFEIYIKNSIKIPKERDLAYYNSAALPSHFLITPSKIETQAAMARAKSSPRVGVLDVFENQQVGLQGVKDGKIAWPITTLYSETYFREVYDGLDYMAFHGQVGQLNKPRMEKLGINNFVISFLPLHDQSMTLEGRKISELPHVITLPRSFMEKVRARDKAPGLGMEELGKRALGLPVPKH
jgi:hypothetical protein